MRILTMQLDSKLGAMGDNIDRACELLEAYRASDGAPDLVVLPPFYISGRPAGNLLFHEPFIDALMQSYFDFAERFDAPALTTVYIPEEDRDFAERFEGEGEGESDSEDCDDEGQEAPDYEVYWDEGELESLGVAERLCLFADGEMYILEKAIEWNWRGCDSNGEGDESDEHEHDGDACGCGCDGEHDACYRESIYELATIMVGDAPVQIVAGDLDELEGIDFESNLIINFRNESYDELREGIVSGEEIASTMEIAAERKSWILRSACLGGQDMAVYPGLCYAVSPEGELATDALMFEEALLSLDIELEGEGEGEDEGATDNAHDAHVEDGWTASIEGIDEREHGFSVYIDSDGIGSEAADWNAIVLSVRDFVGKNGFSDVVIGLSGGIDSTLVAAIAVDALGPEHVHGVLMPSMYSSEGSVSDANDLAGRLGIDTFTVPIEGPFKAFEEALSPALGGALEGLTRENIQARIRTVILMSFSNNYGWLLLNTGNKSEAAMGYSTLYGDTAGGFAPLGNVYKTRLYELARWRNEQSEVVPVSVIEKAPSAELHPDQKDQDTLPPYETLDEICSLYLESGFDADMIVAEGFDAETVDRVLRLITRNEYKRYNEPIGPWIDGVSLSDDRDWPITNAYVDQTSR